MSQNRGWAALPPQPTPLVLCLSLGIGSRRLSRPHPQGLCLLRSPATAGGMQPLQGWLSGPPPGCGGWTAPPLQPIQQEQMGSKPWAPGSFLAVALAGSHEHKAQALRPAQKFGLGQEGEQSSLALFTAKASSALPGQGVDLVVTWSACYKKSILGGPGEVPPPPSRVLTWQIPFCTSPVCWGGWTQRQGCPGLSACPERGRGSVGPQLSSPEFHSTVGGVGVKEGRGGAGGPRRDCISAGGLRGRAAVPAPRCPNSSAAGSELRCPRRWRGASWTLLAPPWPARLHRCAPHLPPLPNLRRDVS